MTRRAAGAARRRSHARFQSRWWFSATDIRRHDSGNCPKIKELSFGGRSAISSAVKATGMKSAWLASLAMLGGSLMGQAPAADPPAAPAATSPDDAQNRAVARISIINGVVSVRRGDSGEAVAAALNAPLTSTDRLLTGEASRAEIQFDAA